MSLDEGLPWMRVYKDTPFELSMMPWELEPPRSTLMVVVKATFSLGVDGPCGIADEQVPCLGEVPWEDGDPPSLKTETDYAVIKPRGEWYLVGTARAPAGQRVTVLPVRVRIGPSQKQLAVWGDRVWQRSVLGYRPGPPEPFESMPLRWERSFGGPRVPENPVGRGLAPIQVGDQTVDVLPNIEDPARPMVSKDDRPPPVGMFPIPSMWRARIQRTGTYDELWKSSRWPFFPRDFDFTFFNCAPPDQWIAQYWRGDEEIELTGLHPMLPRVHTRLPGIAARLFVEWATPRPPGSKPLELLSCAELEALGPPRLQQVPLSLDTIVVDADAGHAICSWRGLVDVADAQLSNVARVFVVHEPLDTRRPHAEYEAWLLRKLMEEAAEFEAEPETELALVEPAAAPAPDVKSELARAHQQVHDGLVAFFGVFAELESRPMAPAAAVRAQYEELGIDPELIEEPEPAEPQELEDPPSLLRLVAIVRRKLGKPFRDMDLSNAPYQKLDLRGVDFSGSLLTEASLREAVLHGAIFDGATLARADLDRADCLGASFREADLSELTAQQTRFDQAVFDGASGSHARLRASRFVGASLQGTELEECDLSLCDVSGACLDGADLVGSLLDGSNFTGSSLTDTTLESVHAHDAVFDRCSMQDLRASDGADFTRARFLIVDAARAQLQGATLLDANFSGSNLESADLSEATAPRANFLKCHMPGACFDRAVLTEAVLLSANLFEASFDHADLSHADARGAHMFSVNFYRARTAGTVFEGAVLDRTLLSS
jgi:uncharacterized protein YjbI with pentapeptide repeats